MRLYYIYTDSNKAPTLPVEALLLPLRMPLFCSFEIIALVGCGILQSPFFNKINPLGICETALWTIKCLRMFIKRKTAGLRNHLAQQLRVFQHGARAQVVLVERLAIVVRHEERRLQNFEQCFFANVGIGIVDEYARVGVAAGVDIQVYAELFALRDGRNCRENKSAGLP